MKRHIIETLMLEAIAASKQEEFDIPVMDVVLKRLEIQQELQGMLTPAEYDAMTFLQGIRDGKPQYTWNLPKGREPEPAKVEDEQSLANLEPMYLPKSPIFVDGDFNDSYEARIRRSKGKKKVNEAIKAKEMGNPQDYVPRIIAEAMNVPNGPKITLMLPEVKLTEDHVCNHKEHHVFERDFDFFVITYEIDNTVMCGDGDTGEGEGMPTGKYLVFSYEDVLSEDPHNPAEPINKEGWTLDQINTWRYGQTSK